MADKDLGVIAQDITSVDLSSLTGSSYTWNTGAGASSITLDPSWITSVANGGHITNSTTIPYTYSAGYSAINNNTSSTVSIDTGGLTMANGTDITIGGKSLFKAIEQIEERLGILNPNPELEERWNALKDLRKQYIEMEKDLLEKEKIMKILKEK